MLAKFEGNFEQGKLQGQGIMIDSGGNHYNGDFVDGKYHGTGKM